MPEYGVECGYDVVAPQPAITLGESSLVVVDVGYETRPMAGVIVVNEGDAPTKRVPVTADWLDSSGTYIASSEASVRALKPGETWSARVDPLADVEDYGAIDDFEGSVGNVQPALSLDPDGVTLVDDQLRASESEVLVRGAVRNERDSALQYIEVVAKVYDAAGDVIGLAWTNERDLGAGDQLRFEVNPDTKGRNGDVESHEVVLAESSLSI